MAYELPQLCFLVSDTAKSREQHTPSNPSGDSKQRTSLQEHRRRAATASANWRDRRNGIPYRVKQTFSKDVDRFELASQELKGLKEGDDPEEGAGEEGVTFNLWKKTELPPPSEPVFDEV